IAAMVTAAAVNLFGAFTGNEVSAAPAIMAVSIVAIGAFVAVNNNLFLGLAVDGVSLVLGAIGNAPIKGIIQPGLGIGNFTSPLIGPILTIVFLLVALALIIVLAIEVAWASVLSGLAGLWVFLSFVPFI